MQLQNDLDFSTEVTLGFVDKCLTDNNIFNFFWKVRLVPYFQTKRSEECNCNLPYLPSSSGGE